MKDQYAAAFNHLAHYTLMNVHCRETSGPTLLQAAQPLPSFGSPEHFILRFLQRAHYRRVSYRLHTSTRSAYVLQLRFFFSAAALHGRPRRCLGSSLDRCDDRRIAASHLVSHDRSSYTEQHDRNTSLLRHADVVTSAYGCNVHEHGMTWSSSFL